MWYTNFRKVSVVQNGGEGMYSAIDIARYIIKYSNEKEYRVSNLKLQKLLYFVQAYFLISLDKPAFSERIEAWSFGPVVPVVYREFKKYGSADIPPVGRWVFKSEHNFWDIYHDDYSYIPIKKAHKKIINKVVDEFSEYSAVGLMKLTHDQTPWKEAFNPQSYHHNNEITNKDIKKYFEE